MTLAIRKPTSFVEVLIILLQSDIHLRLQKAKVGPTVILDGSHVRKSIMVCVTFNQNSAV